LTIIWHIIFTSAIDQSDAGSDVAGSNRYNTLVDPRGVERERWFLVHNWSTWLHTLGVLPAHADFRLGQRKIHSPVCERFGTLDNGWEYWLIHGLRKILAHPR
jgi:hypothetical protein